MIIPSRDVRQDLRRAVDVAIVGSGAGGGPLARELASAGHAVLVVEEGAHFTREDFNLKPAEAYMRMYRDAGQTVTMGLPFILLPLGKTVGGTTTVNSGTALRMHPPVLKKWRMTHGLDDITQEELNLIYGHLEEYLFVKRADPEVAGKVATTFLSGAEKLGLSCGWLPRNAKECEGFGSCVFGCPSGSKQSVDVTFIPDAVSFGADVYTGCRAERILVRDGKAVGISCQFLDEATGKPNGRRLEVEARVVVLAAGAICTPYLLLRQGLANSSGQVGKNLAVHPCTQAVALFDEVLGPPRGIPQACYVDEFQGEGIMLEGGTVPPEIHVLSLPFAGRRSAGLMVKYPNMGIFGGMVSESVSGGVVKDTGRPGYRPNIFYLLRGQDVEKAKAAVVLMAEIWFAAGARRVFTAIAGHYELTGPRDLRNLERSRVRVTDFYGMSAYHPLGTCRMGGDPEWSVVRHTCETWDVENLYVCDGSVLPSSPGVNPQLTIMAMAMRCAGFIDEKLGAGGAGPREAERRAARADGAAKGG
ncbi:MAG: GMC family oxidoreductase [Actinobacteria bacterium]|nr:GMC family oxidoreductase [Actinomycetota bacterium]